MGSIAVGDVIRLTARMLVDGVHDVVSVYHHKAISTNSGTDDDFMVGAALFLDTAHALINVDITDRLSYVNVEGINVTASRLLPTKPWPTLIIGSTAGAMLPERVAGCVFFRTLRPKTRAAKFIGGYTVLSLNGGAVSIPAQANLQAYGNLLVGGFASDGAVMDYGAYNLFLDRFTVVDSAIVPTRWRTIKGRLFGQGS